MNSLKNLLFIAALIGSSFANAHEVWLVKSAKGDEIKLYLGEPGEPESGDSIAGLKNAQVFVNFLRKLD